MKISILGAGAMGMLFGGYLSGRNEVWLVDVDPERVEKINAHGVTVREKDGEERTFWPRAVTDSSKLGQMELVIVFVKSMFTTEALTGNSGLIGRDTYLMTLQNGAGHEETLLRFTDTGHVIIGTTQHNAAVLSSGVTSHGGEGVTAIGALDGDSGKIAHIAEEFSKCGLECNICDEVRRQIWTKLFTNTAASVLTAVLQVPLEFIYRDAYARELMHRLCREAVAVANAQYPDGFDEEQVIETVEAVCKNSRNGYTSIYADIKNARRTEVDTISGSVVAAARELTVPVPCHEMIVGMIHALEDKSKFIKQEGE